MPAARLLSIRWRLIQAGHVSKALGVFTLSGLLCDSLLSMVDREQHLYCRLICTIGASLVRVYGIALYLEFPSSLGISFASLGFRGDWLLSRVLGRCLCDWRHSSRIRSELAKIIGLVIAASISYMVIACITALRAWDANSCLEL